MYFSIKRVYILLLWQSAFLISCSQDINYRQKRDLMIKTQLEERNITYKNVLGSISKVERHLYVPEKYTEFVYNNYPLRIGYGQTIFQPYLEAYMILILNLEKTDKVLEIGTGSVYQTAILV